MERQRRSAPRVTDFRKYHLSGDLEEVVQGKVSDTIEHLEATLEGVMSRDMSDDNATPEQLQEMLREQKENSSKLQQQVEAMKIRNELEAEKLHQEQWELAMKELQEEREQMMVQHESNVSRIKTMAKGNQAPSHAVAWLQDKLSKVSNPSSKEVEEQDTQKQMLIEELTKQQEELQRKIEDIKGSDTGGQDPDLMELLHKALGERSKPKSEQEVLLEQTKMALAPKEANKDPNKALLKALITSQNKTNGIGGVSTLKPDLLNKLTNEAEFSMAEWLASLNKQQEGESEVNRLLSKYEEESDCRAECRHAKMKSGMLDKSTTNIRHKEIWPQKNLGEDWAEEEIEFKQLRFEHLVAGETRTIETCSNPAQILGQLKLLRRIAYLKLRGIEWHLLRKMYAAILSSIETREYSWDSNFDRFESILYRRALVDRNQEKEHKQSEGRKRFCRDYNRPEGCPKNSPHMIWVGSGSSASKKLVYHCCAACLIRDKTMRDHAEIHQECPHRN